MAGKSKRRVVLFSTQPLLGEALEKLLNGVEELELIGQWYPDAASLERVPGEAPDVVLLATQESGSEDTAHLTAQILARYPDYPLVQVTIEETTIRLFTSESHLARSADLIDAIRKLPWKNQD
jgi:DNA-binding NarL/FixJ family response regulator